MGNSTHQTSRQALLGTLAATPTTTLATAAKSAQNNALVALYTLHDDPPPTMGRTKDGRELSLARYHRAESFFQPVERDYPLSHYHQLYLAGIVAQLALSSHLLDIGLPDDWCARNIGLRVAKSLDYANATGFNHHSGEMSRLADVLTPYNKWNAIQLWHEPTPDDGGFTAEPVRLLLRNLLDEIHQITGHSRPKGWHGAAHDAARS